MERSSILPILFFAIGMGLANVIYGGSLGIFLSAIIGAICGALGVGVNELIDRFKNKRTSIAEKSAIDNGQNELENKEENKEPYLYGFGGWLILLALGLMAAFGSSLLYIFGELIPFFFDGILEELIAYNALWGLIFLVGVIANVGIVAFITMIGIFCIKQKKEFKNTVIYFAIFNVLITLLAYLAYLIVPETAATSQDSLVGIFMAIVYAAIWIPYIVKSKRVNNTFIL